MTAMITARTNSSFFSRQPDADLFIEAQRISKLRSYVATLARMAELVDFPAIAASVDAACPRPDRSRGGRRPYPTEIMVREVFLDALYNLSGEEYEHQVLDRRSFKCFCLLDGWVIANSRCAHTVGLQAAPGPRRTGCTCHLRCREPAIATARLVSC